MRIYSMDTEGKRRNSNWIYYLLAALIAIVIFFTGLFLFKGVIWLVRLGIEYWIWIVGAIILLLVIRKLLTRKKVILQNENPS